MPFFGNRAMLIMCAIFFALPFILRGAREAIDTTKNDVTDWLPASFEETTELRRFRDYFIGDQFVVVSWDGCNLADQRYQLLLQKIRRESEAHDDQLRQELKSLDPSSERFALIKEELEARDWATEIGLHTTGDYHIDWGEHNEKWLQGKNKQWYFIKSNGDVFKWNGQNNLIHAVGRSLQKFFKGKNRAEGTFVKRFGTQDNNRFYQDPTLMSARFFADVTTGPEIFEKMAGENGTMRVGQWKDGELSAFKSRIETHKRLSGVLFGPTPPPEFDWTLNSLLDVIPPEKQVLIDEDRKVEYQLFIEELLESTYNGSMDALQNAPQETKLEHWFQIWQRLDIDAPPRQTCLLVTLNDPVLNELARVVGRPVLGKPRGRILELATGQCGIEPENLHLGGPPVDNVAIDEEGSITLFRLVSLSAIIGFTLAYLSFRSIRVTLMLFFVGGVAAIASLSFVWFGGTTMDAILMTMPSLVYVLGLSGAVHVVNYYRDACRESGPTRAADIAVRHGLFPCSLAAFTTALGLISLYTSNLVPIKKFGLFSAVATLATVILLFTYLPASLTIWPPGYRRQRNPESTDLPQRKTKMNVTAWVDRFWDRTGRWVVRNHAVVSITSVILLVVFAYGISRVETSVQLLKLFRSDAKILRDYAWMERNLGKLVPMELVIEVDVDAQERDDLVAVDATKSELLDNDLKLSILQRMELSDRVRRFVLAVFGDESPIEEKRIVGNSMSSDVATPLSMVVSSQEKSMMRLSINQELRDKRSALLEQDYLRIDDETFQEMWRISLRLAALNNVDYGQFVSELKTVVEPVMAGYRYRLRILKALQKRLGESSLERGGILVIGPAPSPRPKNDEAAQVNALASDGSVDQTQIFVDTLRDLIENSGFRGRGIKEIIESQPGKLGRFYSWRVPSTFQNPPEPEAWKRLLTLFDCVVVVQDHEKIDLPLTRQASAVFIDASDHRFEIDPSTKKPLPGMMTAAQRHDDGDEVSLVTTTYTGIVPIVYKAQRSLLASLIKSICLAFFMIAIVMMVLLRPWGERLRLGNALNFRAGMISMLPNVFPVVIIFGAMGHVGNLVDIGSMMTASVAMGVAVDDTIHFLNWFRKGMREGLDRLSSIRLAYRKVATAMTQTTLIGGLGLSAFAFSTFMPTQRFGILMLFLLVAALIGDLILLPALLAGPLGKLFYRETGPPRPGRGMRARASGDTTAAVTTAADGISAPDSQTAGTADTHQSRDPVQPPYIMKNRQRMIGESGETG